MSNKRIEKKPDAYVKIDRIIGTVCALYNVDRDLILSQTRGEARISFVRHLAMYLCASSITISYVDLGKHFGRDRSIIRYAIRHITQVCDDSFEFEQKLDRLVIVAEEIADS